MPDVIRAVLFDLDGTMVDNMRFHVDAWIEIGRKLGRELTPDPRATLVFEDAVLGVQAGRAAGMSVCGVTTSEESEVLLAAGAKLRHFVLIGFALVGKSGGRKLPASGTTRMSLRRFRSRFEGGRSGRRHGRPVRSCWAPEAR